MNVTADIRSILAAAKIPPPLSKASSPIADPPPNQVEPDIHELSEGCRITTGTAIEQRETLIEIGGAPFVSRGDIAIISGAAKSRKTMLSMAIVAAAFVLGHYSDRLKVTLSTGRGLALYIDTEQGLFDTSKFIKRLQRLGITDEEIDRRFILLNFRQLELDKFRDVVEYYLKKYPEIELVFIDGSRDFVSNINNPDEATNFVHWALKTAADYKIGIVNVLHFNKTTIAGDSSKLRGHIGTELQNKSESVLQVEKIEGAESSLISALFCRGVESRELELSLENDLPVLKDYVSKVTKRDEKDPLKQTADALEWIAAKALQGKGELSQTRTISAVKGAISEHLNFIVGEETVRKSWLSCLENVGLISSRREGQRILYKAVENEE